MSLAETMRVIEISLPGGPEVLTEARRPKSQPGPGEVLIQVKAIGINRPDIQQRRGLYPPPPGATDLPGLDAAGTVVGVGAGVNPGLVGREVCALTNGGAYAEFCAVPWQQTMPWPDGFDAARAAALPEVLFTAWNNVVWLGRLQRGETLLVQGGTSGVGMAAIQIARRLFDARVIATASSAEKRQVCLDLGADAAIDYRAGDWPGQVNAATGGRGCDVILDAQAGPTVNPHLNLLAFDGRLVLIASHQAQLSEVDTRQLVRRRLTLTGSTLRPRDAAYKGRLAEALVREVWPLLATGEIRIDICATFPFERMAEAHRVLDENRQIGKVVVLGPQAA
jgi:putative PIG3 family NAD(P)H quinone oxidoreductase